MVDAADLRLLEHLVELRRERLRGGEVVAERLLHDHARVRRQAGGGEARDHRAEQERRDLEVEDRRPAPPIAVRTAAYVAASPKSPLT